MAIDAIVEIKRRNPRFGYPRIARIISKAFGHEIDRNVLRRVLASPGGDTPAKAAEDYVRRQRHDVKSHAVPSHGKIKELYPHADYGVIETSDDREVYFHRNSVLNEGFDKLQQGTRVDFIKAGKHPDGQGHHHRDPGGRCRSRLSRCRRRGAENIQSLTCIIKLNVV